MSESTMRTRPRRRLRLGMENESLWVNLGNYLFAIGYALVILIPLYYLVVSSFKDNQEIFMSALGLPHSFDLSNFAEAVEKADLFGAMRVSFGVVLATEVAVLVVGFVAAYAIARVPSRMATWVETFFGTGFLIPTFAMQVPVFLIIARLGLLYKPLALVLVYVAQTLPLTVLILASAIRQIPREMEEAAVVDGANRLQTMWNVTFPLSRSGVVTVLVLNFLFVWNEFLFALILLGQNVRTIQIAVPLLKSWRLIDYGLLSAGVVISLVPVFIIFIIFQEQIVSGLTRGAVKG